MSLYRANRGLQSSFLMKNSGMMALVGAGGKTTLMFNLARELASTGRTVLTTTTTKIFVPRPSQTPSLICSKSVKQLEDKARYLLTKHAHITMGADVFDEQNKLLGLPAGDVEYLWQRALFDWILVEADGSAGRPFKAPASHEPVVPAGCSHFTAVVGLEVLGKPLQEKWVFRSGKFSEMTGKPLGSAVTIRSVAQVLTGDQVFFQSSPAEALRIAFFNKSEGQLRFVKGMALRAVLKTRGKNKIDRIILGSAMNRRISWIDDLRSKWR